MRISQALGRFVDPLAAAAAAEGARRKALAWLRWHDDPVGCLGHNFLLIGLHHLGVSEEWWEWFKIQIERPLSGEELRHVLDQIGK